MRWYNALPVSYARSLLVTEGGAAGEEADKLTSSRPLAADVPDVVRRLIGG